VPSNNCLRPHIGPIVCLLLHTFKSLCCPTGDTAQQQQVAEDNLRLLEVQNPKLATEGIWAHATAQVEKGGLLLATPDNPLILGTERYW